MFSLSMAIPGVVIPFLFQSRRDVPKSAQAGTDRRLVVDVSETNVAQPWVGNVMTAQPQRGGAKEVRAAPLGNAVKHFITLPPGGSRGTSGEG